MTRYAHAVAEPVEPLGLDPTCTCLICLTACGDCGAAERLVDCVVDVVAEAFRSGHDVVDEMRRRFRRSALAPALVELVLTDVATGSGTAFGRTPADTVSTSRDVKQSCSASRWIRARLHEEQSRRQLLEAIVDVIAELSPLCCDVDPPRHQS